VKELIEYVARNLVDDPEQVEVTQVRRGSEIVFKLHVAKEDMGRVIGKQGRIANAIRALVNVSAARNGKTVELDIEDPR